MIHTIKSLCQITENSSDMQFFWLVDLNTLFVGLKAASSVNFPFLKLYCSVTSTTTHTYYCCCYLYYQSAVVAATTTTTMTTTTNTSINTVVIIVVIFVLMLSNLLHTVTQLLFILFTAGFKILLKRNLQ